jgi:ABC-type Zn uptake system ZnuABC Zn-binding protein ZnuA
VTVVPAGMCPGHFDIRPGDVKVLETAKVLMEHGFEGELFVENMLKLVENPEMLRVTLNVRGNWMVPKVHIQAIDKIVENLNRLKPGDAEFFKSKAKNYKHQITQAGKEIQRKAKELGVGEIKVVCSQMQLEFVDWFGFKIVSTYGRPEDFTPNELKRIVKKAKEGNAKIVIDNLQSGSKAGVPVAEEIGALRVVLTNFPQDSGGELSYLNSLKENASKLFKAIKE